MLLSSLIGSAALIRAAEVEEAEKGRMTVVSLGVGPAALSWVLISAIKWVPHQSALFYIGLVVVFFVMLAFYSRVELLGLMKGFVLSSGALIRSIRSANKFEQILWLLLLGLVASNVFLALFLPLTENDAIQYVVVSKMIYLEKTVAFYPLTDPDPETGFYATSSHPLGFLGLYVWAFLIQGGVSNVQIVSLITPFYVLFTLLALYGMCRGQAKGSFLFAGIVFMLTPVYYVQSSQLSIDAFRIYLMLSAFLWVVYCASKQELGFQDMIPLSVVAAASIYAHSIGMLFTLPFLMPILFVLMRGAVRRKLALIMFASVVALLIGGWRMLDNMMLFGVPVYDSLPVYDLENIHYREYVWFGNGMYTISDRIVHGLLRGFSKPRAFGFSYWLFAGFLFLMMRRLLILRGSWRSAMMEVALILFVLGFMFTVALTLVLGMPVMVAGDRYMMTPQPWIAFGAGVLLAKLYGFRSVA